MTPAAARNLQGLLDREPPATDDGPTWSYAGPEFGLHHRSYARRLVLATLRRYGMTGGWYSTLTDPEIRSLEDLRGIGRTIVQKSLHEEELAGRIVRFTRFELIGWLRSIGRADLAELPQAKRFIVDLRPLAELLGRDLVQAASDSPQPRHMPRLRWSESEHPAAAHAAVEASEASPLACARASNLGFKERDKDKDLYPSPFNPPDDEVERLRREATEGSFVQRCTAINRLVELGLVEVPDETPAAEPRRHEPAPAEPFSTPPRRASMSPAAERTSEFVAEGQRLAGLLAEAETRDAVAARLVDLIATRFKVTDPAGLLERLWWFGTREHGRNRLAGLFYDAMREENPSRCFWGGVSKILKETDFHRAQKPAPTSTRQSSVGAGLTNCVSVMANSTQGATL